MTCQKILNTYSEINEYVPLEIPERPMELDSFYSLPNERQISVKDEFFRQEHIQTYLNEKWRVELHNRDCFLRLWEIFSTTTDSKERNAAHHKLNTFKRVIEQYKKPYIALRLDFSKYPFGEIREEIGWDD